MLMIEWLTDSGTTEVMDFDAVIQESYESPAEVTEHAVERGAAVTDHVRAQGDTISIEAMVSNVPIVTPLFGMEGAQMAVSSLGITVDGKKTSASVLQATQPFDRIRAVDEALRGLRDAGQLLTIRTKRRVVTDCVITRYKVSRGQDIGEQLSLNLDLKRVRLASSERVAVAATRQRRGQRERNRGAQPAQPVDNRSALARGIDGSRSAVRSIFP